MEGKSNRRDSQGVESEASNPTPNHPTLRGIARREQAAVREDRVSSDLCMKSDFLRGDCALAPSRPSGTASPPAHIFASAKEEKTAAH